MMPAVAATCALAGILGLANLVLAVLTGRFALQSFQQNTYRTSEYGPWFRANWKKVSSTLITMALGVAAILLSAFVLPLGIVIGLVALAFTVFVIYYFNFLRTHLKKKALVYTARVKRLVAADAVLCAVVCVALLVPGLLTGSPFGVLGSLTCAFCLLPPLQMLLVPFAGVILEPAERSNNQRYIDEARTLLAECPDLTVVGITGSYGKTSMKHYLAELLRNRYDVLITPGNFNTTLGVVRTVRERLKPTHEVFLCEMGARHTGDIAEICELVHPTMGIITSVGPAHLETFGSLDAVKATKFELVDAVLGAKKAIRSQNSPGNEDRNAPDENAGDPSLTLGMTKGREDAEAGAGGAHASAGAAGNVFLNFDSEPVREQAAAYASETAAGFTAYGENDQAGYRIAAAETSRAGTRFTIVAPDGESCEFSTKLVGRHNVGNIAGAIAAAHALGVPLGEMRVPVRRLKPVEHRLDLKVSGTTTILDDAYNSNPVGARAALDVLELFDDGLKILVTPGMVELGDEQRRLNAEFASYAARVCDDVIVVGAHNREALLEGLADAGFPQAHTHCSATIQDALRQAHAISAGQPRTILMENDLPDIY